MTGSGQLAAQLVEYGTLDLWAVSLNPMLDAEIT